MQNTLLKYGSAKEYRIWMRRVSSKCRKTIRKPLSLKSSPTHIFAFCIFAFVTSLILMVDPTKQRKLAEKPYHPFSRSENERVRLLKNLQKMGIHSLMRKVNKKFHEKINGHEEITFNTEKMTMQVQQTLKGRLARKLHKNYYGSEEVVNASSQMIQNAVNGNRVVRIMERENQFSKYAKNEPCPSVKPDCPVPTNLQTRLNVTEWIKLMSLEMTRGTSNVFLNHPGAWSPEDCTSRHSVAIIIPYRQRRMQLHLLLQHLPVILQRQKISYSIFLVEQVGNGTFNKGIVMNAGFLTSLSYPAHGVPFHCFIFHDVDLISEDDRNMYTCPEYPTHMSSGVDEFGYKLPYDEIVGGALAIRMEHFLQVNGYSNLYWGWGGEDDDMGFRIRKSFGYIRRRPTDIGRYTSIHHAKQIPAPLLVRRRLKTRALIRSQTDGLNSVRYELVSVLKKTSYYHIFIDVGSPPDSRKTVWKSYGMGSHNKEMRKRMVRKHLQELEAEKRIRRQL